MKSHTCPTDHKQASEFLAALAPDDQLTFQTFPEKPFKTTCKAGPQILHGSYSSVSKRLSDLNEQGHGIFLMVNQGDLKGRKAENVKRVRAHFIDIDDAPIDPVLACELPPPILVESSPNKWHAYWLVEDCPLDQFKLRQRALIQKFAADPTAIDLCRVLRMPGYWHRKDIPFQTRLVKPQPH
jgi:hypothetical protein